jgi:hypothetical protein
MPRTVCSWIRLQEGTTVYLIMGTQTGSFLRSYDQHNRNINSNEDWILDVAIKNEVKWVEHRSAFSPADPKVVSEFSQYLCRGGVDRGIPNFTLLLRTAFVSRYLEEKQIQAILLFYSSCCIASADPLWICPILSYAFFLSIFTFVLNFCNN